MALVNITDENFKELVDENKGTVLIDFYATWCAPCKAQSPIIDEIAAERDDITVGKIDVDEQGALAAMCSVSSIPTLVIVKNGEIVARTVGLTSKKDVLAMLD